MTVHSLQLREASGVPFVLFSLIDTATPFVHELPGFSAQTALGLLYPEQKR